MDGGDLDHLIFDSPSRLSTSLVRQYMAELVYAINELHKLNIIHRDLKPANIFIDKQGRLVIGDFGPLTTIMATTTPLQFSTTLMPIQIKHTRLAGHRDIWLQRYICKWDILFQSIRSLSGRYSSRCCSVDMLLLDEQPRRYTIRCYMVPRILLRKVVLIRTLLTYLNRYVIFIIWLFLFTYILVRCWRRTRRRGLIWKRRCDTRISTMCKFTSLWLTELSGWRFE